MPDKGDFMGVITGIFRLQDTYVVTAKQLQDEAFCPNLPPIKLPSIL